MRCLSYKLKRPFFIIPLTICFSGQMNAKVHSDQKTCLNDNWLFLKSDLGNIWEAVRPALAGNPESVPLWENVTLPHCFNAEDAVDPGLNYYQGPGWYKTLLDIDNPYKDGRILLDFEGAGQKTNVFIYTTEVGNHVGGYDEWCVDITDAVRHFEDTDSINSRFQGRIPLSVRCDNSRDAEMIPSDLSDFNIYGGLYRNVNLVYLPPVSIRELLITSELGNRRKKASVKVRTSFYNPIGRKNANLQLCIYTPKNELLIKKDIALSDLDNEFEAEFYIDNPSLWSTDSPLLYRCNAILTHANESVSSNEHFGIRDFEFVPKGPFKLNGERLLLRGTHRHEDHAGMGAALSDSVMEAEMNLIKKMGANFIRLGHYQQSRRILELCDRMGILVWEEIPWCRGGLGGEKYKQQARRMLTNMITQHYNHPSVIIWGLGNENDWPNDFAVFNKQHIREFMSELNELSHQLDPSRKTAIRRCEFSKDIVDVYSPSIWAGWYKGVFTDYKRVAEAEKDKVGSFFHAEWGGDSHACRHTEDPFVNLDKIQMTSPSHQSEALYTGTKRGAKDGEWTESYIVRLIDWHLKEQETMPWLTGSAYWSFKDFSTPVRPENPVPYVNQKGIVERDLTPKEAFYVFQSYWSKEPMLHIYGHTWPIRWGMEDELKEILVYSNCSRVELIVNGKSCGVKKRDSQDYPAAGLRWNVRLNPGENKIQAVSKDKSNLTDSLAFLFETRRWEKPSALRIRQQLLADNIIEIEAQLIDKAGVPCLDSREYIHFGITGDGKLIHNQGTSRGSSIVQAYNGRAVIRVVAGGVSVVSIKSPGIDTHFLKL